MISGIKWQLPRTEAWLIMAPLWPPLEMPAPVDNGRVCVCYGLSPLLLWFPGSICVIQNANGRLYGPSRGLAHLQVHSLLVVSKRFFWLKEDPELHYELFDNKNRLNGCVCRVFMWVCVLASVCVSVRECCILHLYFSKFDYTSRAGSSGSLYIHWFPPPSLVKFYSIDKGTRKTWLWIPRRCCSRIKNNWLSYY